MKFRNSNTKIGKLTLSSTKSIDYGRIPLSRPRARWLFRLLVGWILLAGGGSLMAAFLGQAGDYQGWAFRANDSFLAWPQL